MKLTVKRVFGFLLSFTLVLGLLPGMGLTAWAEEYPLKIKGIRVTTDYKSDTGWEFIYGAGENILNLNNFSYIGDDTAIRYMGSTPLRIVLTGMNTISIQGNKNHGIHSSQGGICLTSNSNGSLDITINSDSNSDYGILTEKGNITIDHCTLTTSGGYIGINNTGDNVYLDEGCQVVAGGRHRGVRVSKNKEIIINKSVKSVVAYGGIDAALDNGNATLDTDVLGVGYNTQEGSDGTGEAIGVGTYTITNLRSASTNKRFKRVEFPKSTYEITKTQDVEHVIGNNKDAVITVCNTGDDSVTFKRFNHTVSVDGGKIRETYDFSAKAGSLILTLKSEYLDKLVVGDHKVTINFIDGSVTANIKIKAAPTPTPAPVPTSTPDPTPDPTATPKPVPKTGDNANPTLWLGMILIGLLAIGGIAFTVRKRG